MRKIKVEQSEVDDLSQALERMKNSKDLIERDVQIMLGKIGVNQSSQLDMGKTSTQHKLGSITKAR